MKRLSGNHALVGEHLGERHVGEAERARCPAGSLGMDFAWTLALPSAAGIAPLGVRLVPRLVARDTVLAARQEATLSPSLTAGGASEAKPRANGAHAGGAGALTRAEDARRLRNAQAGGVNA